MERRLAQIEESVARYLHQLDSADRQEQSLARETKTTRLKEKIAKLREEMQRDGSRPQWSPDCHTTQPQWRCKLCPRLGL
jgi:hypothetical protein